MQPSDVMLMNSGMWEWSQNIHLNRAMWSCHKNQHVLMTDVTRHNY